VKKTEDVLEETGNNKQQQWPTVTAASAPQPIEQTKPTKVFDSPIFFFDGMIKDDRSNKDDAHIILPG
jgi:hypothetical protein